ISRLVSSTLVPSIESTEILLSPSRVTSAVLPSGVMATWLGPDLSSPRLIFPTGVSACPATKKTETVPSERLATSASVPARLIDTPAAPLPACSCAEILGGEALRSMTVSLSSGTVFFGSLGSTLGCAGHQRETLVARERYAPGRPNDARRSLKLGDHLRWRRTEVDDGHRIRRRVGRHRIHAVDEDGLAVIRGKSKLPARARRYRDQRGERQRAEPNHMAMHANLPLGGIVRILRTRAAPARIPSYPMSGP